MSGRLLSAGIILWILAASYHVAFGQRPCKTQIVSAGCGLGLRERVTAEAKLSKNGKGRRGLWGMDTALAQSWLAALSMLFHVLGVRVTVCDLSAGDASLPDQTRQKDSPRPFISSAQ